MLRRSTLVVLVIFLVVLGGLFYWQNLHETKEQTQPTATLETSIPVFDLGDNGIIRIGIVDRAGKAIAFERQSTEVPWTMVGQSAELIDSTQIEYIANELAYLMVDMTLENEPPLDVIGLNDPAYVVTLILEGGKQIVFRIGNITPTGNGYYVKVDENPVNVVAKYDLDEIVGTLYEPPLLPTQTPDLTLTTEPIPTMTPEISSTPVP